MTNSSNEEQLQVSCGLGWWNAYEGATLAIPATLRRRLIKQVAIVPQI